LSSSTRAVLNESLAYSSGEKPLNTMAISVARRAGRNLLFFIVIAITYLTLGLPFVQGLQTGLM
ncbi:hypothetical protein V7P28_28755, partial [Klebsiella michiganensis]